MLVPSKRPMPLTCEPKGENHAIAALENDHELPNGLRLSLNEDNGQGERSLLVDVNHGFSKIQLIMAIFKRQLNDLPSERTSMLMVAMCATSSLISCPTFMQL